MSSSASPEHDENSPTRKPRSQSADASGQQTAEMRNSDPLLAFDHAVTLSDPDTINAAAGRARRDTLITPRTQHVLRQLGIRSLGLLQDPTMESITAEMRAHHLDRNLVHDSAVVQRRLQFKQDAVRRLMSQALRAYHMVLQAEAEEAPQQSAQQQQQQQQMMTTPAHQTSLAASPSQSSDRLGGGGGGPASMNHSTTHSSIAGGRASTPGLQRPPTATGAGGGSTGRDAARPSSAASRRHIQAIHQSSSTIRGGSAAGRSRSQLASTTPSARRSPSAAGRDNAKSSASAAGGGGGGSNNGAAAAPSPHIMPHPDDDEDDLAEVLRNAEHIKSANMKRLEQLLLKREIVRFKHDRMRDEHEKQAALEREKEAKHKAAERKAAQEQMQSQLAREAQYRREREQRQDEMMEKRGEFEARTRDLDYRWMARRQRLMHENKKKAELNLLRRAAQAEHQEQSLSRKRQVAEQGQLIAEILLARRRQEQHEAKASALDGAAEQARYRLAEVRARGEALADARLQKLKEKEARELEIAKQQEEARRRELELKREKEQQKAERRERALLGAVQHSKEQQAKVQQAVDAYAARQERQRIAREHEHLMRQERMREVEIAHDMFRERQGASLAAKRDDLESAVLEKNVRVAALAQKRESRRMRRLLIRQEADKTRWSEPPDAPGPGAYDVVEPPNTGAKGFSFGVPFSAMGARQVDRHTPSVNYLFDASPGCVYNPKLESVKPHKKTAMLPRSERWMRTEQERNPTPAPNAYSPHSKSRVHDLSEEQLEQVLLGGSPLKHGSAKRPHGSAAASRRTPSSAGGVDRNLSWSQDDGAS